MCFHVLLELLPRAQHFIVQIEVRLLQILKFLILNSLLVDEGLNVQELVVEQVRILLDVVFKIFD